MSERTGGGSSSLPRPQAGKLITCFLPNGRALPLLERLKAERGIDTAFAHHSRGMGFSGARHRSGIAEQTEKEILLVAVAEEQAEALFAWIYREGGIDRPHAGFMFMESLRFTPMAMPE